MKWIRESSREKWTFKFCFFCALFWALISWLLQMPWLFVAMATVLVTKAWIETDAERS